MMVFFLFNANYLRLLIIWKAVKESNPDVGSSNKMHYGSEIKSNPI